MYDVVTFGSATGDVFLKLNRGNFRVLRDKAFGSNKGLCFSLGGKFLVDDTTVFSGGGGTNTACTFSNQGFKTAYVGRVGEDVMGDMVFSDLKTHKVSTTFLQCDKKRKTALSVVLSTNRERTILIYKGACHFLELNDIPFAKLKRAKWFYIAPLYDKSADLLSQIIRFARENKISVAFNPGSQRLKLGRERLKPVLAHVDALILNDREAMLLSNSSLDRELEMIKELRYICPGVIVITKGRGGGIVCDGSNIFKLETSDIQVVEKTGAGDAFGSAFVAGLLQKNDIEYAIRLATANAESCIQKIGAKNGLLKKGQKVDLSKYKITKSHL